MALHQSVVDWQLCIHWVHMTASASGHAHHLDWWRLATATASPGFIQNPRGAHVDARSGAGPSCKARKLNPSSKSGDAHASPSRACSREAYFADNETARQMTACLSAVSKLKDEEAKELVCQLVDKTESCPGGRNGELGDHLSRLEELVQAATQAEETAAEEAAARAAACIPEGGSSEEDLDMEGVQVLRGGAAGDCDGEQSPLHIAGAGCWDACTVMADVRGAALQSGCAEEPEWDLTKGTASPRAEAVHGGARQDACCGVAEVSPMRISGAGSEGGWPGCFDDERLPPILRPDDGPSRSTRRASSSRAHSTGANQDEDAKRGPSVSKRTRRSSRLKEVIEGQVNAGGAAACAQRGVAGSTRGSTTGAVPVSGPAAGTRSPFGAAPSPDAAMQRQQGASGAGELPEAPQSKRLRTFGKAMGDGCFNVSGSAQPGNNASPSKLARDCAGPAQTSGTAGGVSTALPPHLISSPGQQMSKSVGMGAGGSIFVAIAAGRTSSSGAATGTTRNAPSGMTSHQALASTSPIKGQGDCDIPVDADVAAASEPAGAEVSAGNQQPRDGSNRCRTRSAARAPGGQLPSVPEGAAVLPTCEVLIYQFSV